MTLLPKRRGATAASQDPHSTSERVHHLVFKFPKFIYADFFVLYQVFERHLTPPPLFPFSGKPLRAAQSVYLWLSLEIMSGAYNCRVERHLKEY